VCPTALISIISILRGIGDSKADVCPFFEKHESVENISELHTKDNTNLLKIIWYKRLGKDRISYPMLNTIIRHDPTQRYEMQILSYVPTTK
jgi:hypothetical protein